MYTQEELYADEGYWIGRLSATIANSVQYLKHKDATGARALLSSELKLFLRSPVADPELCRILREIK